MSILDELVDLVAFLFARVKEDEAAARAVGLTDLPTMRGGCRGIGCQRRAGTGHALGCPARALRECQVKREVVEGYLAAVKANAAATRHREENRGDLGAAMGVMQAAFTATRLELAMRQMVQVYADHPAYDPKWANG